MKYFIILFMLLNTSLFADAHTPYCDSYLASLSPKEAKRVALNSFDTIIDMYLAGTEEQKLDFIANLDDFEVELFMEYLREKYPDEFAQLH